jgi:hypothetical protein
MHAVGQQSTVNSGHAWLQSLLSNTTMEGTVVFFGAHSGNDVIQQQRNRRLCFLCGLFPGYIARTSTAMIRQYYYSESVMTSDGKGCHKSWLQQLEPGFSEKEKRLNCCEL